MALGHRVLERSNAIVLFEFDIAYFARRVLGVDVGPEFNPDAATVVVEFPQRRGIGCDGGICRAVERVAVFLQMTSGVGEVEFGLCTRGRCVVVFILADEGFVWSYGRTGQSGWTGIQIYDGRIGRLVHHLSLFGDHGLNDVIGDDCVAEFCQVEDTPHPECGISLG